MASSPEIVVGLIEGQQAVIERLEGAVSRLADDAVREEAAGVEQRAVARLSCLLGYVAAPALGQIDVFRQLAQRVLVGVDLPGPPERMTWCFGDGAAVIGQICPKRRRHGRVHGALILNGLAAAAGTGAHRRDRVVKVRTPYSLAIHGLDDQIGRRKSSRLPALAITFLDVKNKPGDPVPPIDLHVRPPQRVAEGPAEHGSFIV